jgi:uncharacterized membrane protein YkgB
VKRSAYLSSPGPMIVRDIIYLAMGMLIFSRWGKRTILKENTHAQ